MGTCIQAKMVAEVRSDASLKRISDDGIFEGWSRGVLEAAGEKRRCCAVCYLPYSGADRT